MSAEGADFNIDKERKKAQKRLSGLGDYHRDNYTCDDLINDLNDYFDNEVDFNVEKIRAIIEQPGKLHQLMDRADENNTHPVSELVKEMIKETGHE